MIGFYDYTVILTYLSAASATVGIIASLSGPGHPYTGAICLMLCGLFDAFDGKVARTKADRTEQEKKFGIQIDSLSDLVAFGVLPVCIGTALYRRVSIGVANIHKSYLVLLFAIMVLYVLAALIRLAYYNVAEEERQSTETGNRRSYVGLPVTSAALVFPLVMLLGYFLPMDITPVYLAVMLFTAAAFVSRINVRKPGLRGILIMVGIGALEFAMLMIFELLTK